MRESRVKSMQRWATYGFKMGRVRQGQNMIGLCAVVCVYIYRCIMLRKSRHVKLEFSTRSRLNIFEKKKTKQVSNRA